MRIRPGPDEAHKDIELTRTEARQAGPGFNLPVLIFGLAGVVMAFIIVFTR